LNLQSYEHLLKGGESGASFEANDASASLLYQMIEDGSMPKDADPLTESELAAIRQWIEVGTPLDAGVMASAELFDIMPEVQQPLPPDTYRVPLPVTATAFSPDGNILATSGYHEVLLWNTTDGKLLRRITNVAERVYDLAFNADGSLLAVAAGTPGQLGEAKLFRVSDGTHAKTLVRAQDAIFSVAFSPDDRQLAVAGADRAVSVASVTDGSILLRIDDHADWVMHVNWSSDGNRLVTSSRDKTSKVFNAQTGDAIVTFNGHNDTVYSAVFLTDGKSVASAGADNRVRIWNVSDAKQTREIKGFADDVFAIVLSDQGHLLTASADRNAREHNPADGKLIRTFAGHADWVYAIAVHSGTQRVATGSYDGEVRMWSATDATLQTTFLAVPTDLKAASVAKSGP
jgi:WD40 repeat protein